MPGRESPRTGTQGAGGAGGAGGRRAKHIFFEALDAEPHARERIVDAACAGDPDLKREVLDLLGASARAEASETAITAGRAAIARDLREDGTIGPYKVLQLIGEGGFGVVYMAEQLRPVVRRVALKVIKLGMDTAQVVARFEQERQALAMMDHPNIARVLDAGATDSGRPYFVMELVRGVPITQYCDDKRLTMRERMDLFIPVCRAVAHAHQKGIIHRDIKPSNVLVTVADGHPVPKVIDFGIAKATGARLTNKTLFTEFRQLIGTPEYMSPEQAEMHGVDVDTRSDIYSLGVLLYELLTGTTPFDSRRLRSAAFGEVLRIIREEEPHKPSTRVSTLARATPRAGSTGRTSAKAQAEAARVLEPTAAPREAVAPGPGATNGAPQDAPERHLRAPKSAHIVEIARSRKVDAGQLRRFLQGEIDWIVMKAMDKDRARRYETANALAQDVMRFLRDEPVVAGPPGASYRVRKFAKRNKGLFAAGTAIALALLLGLAAALYGLSVASLERDQKELARAAAENAKEEAETRAAEASRQAYRASIAAAQAAVRSHDRELALRSLAEAPPDLRGWEWKHLSFVSGAQSDTYDFLESPSGALDVTLDGRLVIAGENGAGPVKVFDLASRRLVRTLPITGDIWSPSSSADGQFILISYRSGPIEMWRSDGVAPVWRIDASKRDCVWPASLSSDGTRAAIIMGRDRRVAMADARTGEILREVDLRAVLAPIFSRDGSLVAVQDGGVVEFDTGKILWENPSYIGPFSADGSRVFVRGSPERGGATSIADARTGVPLTSISRRLISPAFKPDGTAVVDCDDNRRVALFNPLTLDVTGSLMGGSARGDASYTADGEWLLLVEWSGRVTRWPGSLRSLPFVIRRPREMFAQSAVTSADGSRHLLGDWGTASLWDARTGEIFWRRNLGTLFVRAVALSPAGDLAALPAPGGAISVVAAEDGREISRCAARDRSEILAMCFTPDGSAVFAAHDTGRVERYDIDRAERSLNIAAHSSAVVGMAVSPDGAVLATLADGLGEYKRDERRIAAAEPDDRLCLWNARTGAPIAQLKPDQGAWKSLLFDPAGRALYAGTATGNIVEIDPATGASRGVRCRGRQAIQCMAISPTGSRLVAGTRLGTIHVWEPRSGDEVATISLGESVESLAFDRSGDSLRVCGDRQIAVFECSLQDPALLRARELALNAYELIERGRYQNSTKEDLLEFVRTAPDAAPAVRERALALTRTIGDRAPSLNSWAWQLISSESNPRDEYERGLHLSLAATAILADEPAFFNTLALAYYRLGRFAEAADAAVKSAELARTRGRSPHPTDFMFLAMSRHGEGRADEARKALEQARALVQLPEFAGDTENAMFLRQAERAMAIPPPAVPPAPDR
jgi:serine/threonine protein kinase/WD40 repeat protein